VNKVEFIWDGEKWIIKGNRKRLCEFVNIECQTCLNPYAFGQKGHSCLTPDPDLCPYHSLNLRERFGDEFVNALLLFIFAEEAETKKARNKK
jgi:hypothetical protein